MTDRKGFLRAAQRERNEILWAYGEEDPEILGPKPSGLQPDVAEEEFLHGLAEVRLVGPAAVAKAARLVQDSLWRYRGQLEEDPFRYSQDVPEEMVQNFIAAAQEALGMDGVQSDTTPPYRQWAKSYPLPSEQWRQEHAKARNEDA